MKFYVYLQALAHCYKPLQLEVIVTDSENRKFDNVSSLALKWDLSDDSLASTPAEPSSLTQVTNLHGYNLPMFCEYDWCFFFILVAQSRDLM